MNKDQYKGVLAWGVMAAAVCLFVKYFKNIMGAGSMILNAAAPLLVGCIIAYVLNILLKKIERIYFPNSKNKAVNKSRRPVSLALSLLLLVLILVLIIRLVVPELLSSFRLIAAEIPPLVEKIRIWAVDQSVQIPQIQDILEHSDIDWQELFKKMADILLTGAGGIFNSVLSILTGVIGTVAQVTIGLIFALYLLTNKEKIKMQADSLMKAYLKPATREKILSVATTVHETFSSFIVGQCTEAVIIGALCTLGMMLFKMPYALMTGTVVGATALIPIVGAYLGAFVGAFMVFTVDPVMAVFFVIFLILLQQVEGNLIYPKVVGSSIGLPGMWVLAAVTIGGGVMGIGGMMLGVPLAASLYKLLGKDVRRRLHEKK